MLIKPFSIRTDTCRVHSCGLLSTLWPHLMWMGWLFYNSQGFYRQQYEVRRSGYYYYYYSLLNLHSRFVAFISVLQAGNQAGNQAGQGMEFHQQLANSSSISAQVKAVKSCSFSIHPAFLRCYLRPLWLWELMEFSRHAWQCL